MSRPPDRFEIVPPVAIKRTRGASCATAGKAGSRRMPATTAERRRRNAAGSTRELYRTGLAGPRRLPPVRQGQPLAQLTGGLVRGPTVEWHQSGGHAWGPSDLRTPPVVHGRHLDLVSAPVNSLFVAMNDHVGVRGGGGNGEILRGRRIKSSEASREGGVHRAASVRMS